MRAVKNVVAFPHSCYFHVLPATEREREERGRERGLTWGRRCGEKGIMVKTSPEGLRARRSCLKIFFYPSHFFLNLLRAMKAARVFVFPLLLWTLALADPERGRTGKSRATQDSVVDDDGAEAMLEKTAGQRRGKRKQVGISYRRRKTVGFAKLFFLSYIFLGGESDSDFFLSTCFLSRFSVFVVQHCDVPKRAVRIISVHRVSEECINTFV